MPQVIIVRAGQKQGTANESAVSAFNERVKQYIKLREKVEGQLPKLSSKSQSQEIEANLVAMQTNIIAARTGVKAGDIFNSEIAGHMRSIIKQEFKGERLRKLRKTIKEVKGVPLRANTPYPETKELIEMTPALLLKLPALPKQLQYRFVGNALLLLDKEARLIVDYMPNALP